MLIRIWGAKLLFFSELHKFFTTKYCFPPVYLVKTTVKHKKKAVPWSRLLAFMQFLYCFILSQISCRS